MPTLTETARLDAVARALAGAHRPDLPPLAVGIASDDAAADLHCTDLRGGDPARELRGFRAPDDWWAFGVASAGTVRSLPDGAPLTEGATFVHLVSRSGASVTRIESADGEPLVRHDEPPAEGRVADACRRVLGLATPSPPADSRLLWALLWLDRVSAVALARPDDPPTWPEVARLYASDDTLLQTYLADHLDDHLVEFGNALGQAWSWSRLRERATVEGLAVAGLSPGDAAWTDEGAFARILLEAYPELDDLLGTLGAVLDESVARQVLDVLRGWGLT